jgi:hypothetical protein
MRIAQAALALALAASGTSACTTTNEFNTDCEALTDATIGDYNSGAGTAIGDWFIDSVAATAKWGHISRW